MAERKHYRACNLCEAICGIEIRVDEDDTILSIRGDKNDPFSRGHICPKAVALQDLHTDPDRLRQPLRRVGDEWQAIGWEEAFDLAAERIMAIQSEHGHDAVGAYLGNPNVHNYGSLLYGAHLLRALRSKNVYSATSVDQLPHQLVAQQMFGHQLMMPIPDIDRTDYLLVLGANPLVSNGSIMTAPDVATRLKDIRKRGGKLVVVDPRRSETAAIADTHLAVQPGTDAFLLAALLHCLLRDAPDNLTLGAFTPDLDQLPALFAAYTPAAVAAVVGISAEAIEQVATDFAAAPSAVCYGRIGICTHEFGALNAWLINLVNIVTGNLDRPGGAMFTSPAFDTLPNSSRGSHGRWHSRVRGLPESGGELPVAALEEEISTPGAGQIRALITIAGNPVLSTPAGQKLDAAMANMDFVLAIDFYLNETTRHADLILPPTGPLEHDHYDIAFLPLAIRNVTKYTQALFEPGENTRHDWQILLALASRIGLDPRGEKMRPLLEAGPQMLLGLALQNSPYKDEGVSLDALKANPHGMDLGPLRSVLPDRLFTADKHIKLIPELLSADLQRCARRLNELQDANTEQLYLIGRRDLRTNNSWLHNSQRMIKGKNRCTALMHPDDVGKRALSDGQLVEVTSRSGSIQLPVEVCTDMRPGVISVPHGWGHNKTGMRQSVASTAPGASVNDLTDPAFLDEVSGNAALNGVPVEVRAIA